MSSLHSRPSVFGCCLAAGQAVPHPLQAAGDAQRYQVSKELVSMQ
jgi:hypothetical protein